MMSRVSVVVPARNEEELLPGCLSAIQGQHFDDFEIVVVDSASGDNTGLVAESLGARVVRLEEPGIARARQAGFEAAEGEIIVSTDADGVVPANWLKRLTAPFSDPEVVGAFGSIHVGEKGVWAKLSSSIFPLFQRVNLKLGRPLFSGPNFALRKSAFQKVDGFAIDGSYPEVAEDVQLALKLRNEGRIVFLRNLSVQTSARRFQGVHALSYVRYHTGVYFRVCWLGRNR